ncbi:iron ABC transporter permease [Idiomarina sp.]|uniref:FecCD family ABC transporter permease n=1 Tax=Idiomarina sp. TaxID=1874361 RepID=UPI0025C56A1E|nr:iron ABC transporter permease [Idiomarina sp.]
MTRLPDSRWLILAFSFILLSAWHLSQGPVTLQITELSQLQKTILLDIRLPRWLLVIGNGMALGLAGATLQLLLRNPLAEPGLIGVSSMSALTTVAVLYFGMLGMSSFLLPLVALAGGLLGLLVILLLAWRQHDVYRVILAGVAVSSLAAALMGLILYLAPNPFAFQEWSLWTLGTLANRSWSHLLLLLPCLVLGVALLASARHLLTALTLSEQTVATLGFKLVSQRNMILLAVALLVAGSVVSAGIIGFIGLLAPHCIRLLGEQHPQRVLWLSAPAGALLLLSMDIITRVISGPRELPVGIVAALVGAPLLIALLMRQYRQQVI